MKIVNRSNEPYEFTFDGGNYGPLMPNEVVDYPEEIALHAIKRSAQFDDDGEGILMGYRVEQMTGSDVKRSELKVRCPYVQTGECAQPPMNQADLRIHLESHWIKDSPALRSGPASSSDEDLALTGASAKGAARK